MSWSVQAVGRAGKVMESLAAQFARAREATAHIPAEQASVEGCERAVAPLLGAMRDDVAVSVQAHGSVSSADGVVQSASVGVKLETLYGFVG